MNRRQKKKKLGIVYVRLDPTLKKWLVELCQAKPGRISQSTMVARILAAAQLNPDFIKAA